MKVKIAAAAQMGNVRKPRLMQTQQHAAPLKDNGLIVAIGASTGGTEAIFSVVKNFGPDSSGGSYCAAYAAGIYGDVC